MSEPRIIKKYPNRRLYDTVESRYITLGDVRKLVVEQVDFVVIDKKTQGDITNSILLQVIADQEHGGDPLMSRDFLSQIIRSYGGGAMQGLAVIPIFAGYDEQTGSGRIFSYDVAGGPYEEHRFHSIGSGSVFARGALKKLYADGMPERDAVLACVQSLYDAADDDSATGGPDLTRRIFPVVATVTDDGFRRLPESEAAEYAQQVVESRMRSPDGPPAPLRGDG